MTRWESRNNEAPSIGGGFVDVTRGDENYLTMYFTVAFTPVEKVRVNVYVPFFAWAASFTLTVNLEAVAAVTVAVVPA